MSSSSRLSWGLALALFLGTLAQMVYADTIKIHGAEPDLLLLIALLGALFCNANGGATLGFCAGLLHAAITAPPRSGFGSLIISSTLVCFGIGWLEGRLYRDNPLLALAFVASGTALCGGLFFVLAPQPHLLHWARALGMTVLYNSALALPAYLITRKLAGIRRSQSD